MDTSGSYPHFQGWPALEDECGLHSTRHGLPSQAAPRRIGVVKVPQGAAILFTTAYQAPDSSCWIFNRVPEA